MRCSKPFYQVSRSNRDTLEIDRLLIYTKKDNASKTNAHGKISLTRLKNKSLPVASFGEFFDSLILIPFNNFLVIEYRNYLKIMRFIFIKIFYERFVGGPLK